MKTLMLLLFNLSLYAQSPIGIEGAMLDIKINPMTQTTKKKKIKLQSKVQVDPQSTYVTKDPDVIPPFTGIVTGKVWWKNPFAILKKKGFYYLVESDTDGKTYRAEPEDVTAL